MSYRTKALAAFAALSIGGGISGYVYSERSKSNLVEVDIPLQRVSDCALEITPYDFTVVDGDRSAEEHARNVANGKSWIKRSRHQDGKAIDIAAYIDGKINFDPKYYYPIHGAFYTCSDTLGIPIITGGEWKVGDYMHIELDRKAYP